MGWNKLPLKDYQKEGARIHELRREGKTLQQIGDLPEFNLTRERIRQIYEKYKLRNPQLHLPIKKEWREVSCEECEKKIQRCTNTFAIYRTIYCQLCREYLRKQKYRKTKRVTFRKHLRSPFCLTCKKEFTKDFPYFHLNRDRKCFNREARYKVVGDRRKAHWLSCFYRGEEYPLTYISFYPKQNCAMIGTT